MSITAVTAIPPAPLPVTATPKEVLANNAAFQLSLDQTGATSGSSTTQNYNVLPTAMVPVAVATNAFANVPTNTAIDPPWSTISDGITFLSYLDNTGIGVSSVATPNPFGSSLPGLGLGALGYADSAYANPFAQLGIGVNLSAFG